MIKKVSIIVPTRNCRDTISSLLDSLQRLNYPNYEIVVVDSSDDGTDRIVEMRKGIKLVRVPALGANVARNLGLSETTGKIVCFIDGDYIALSNWISNFLSEFEKDQLVGQVGGSVYTLPTNLLGKYLNETLISYDPRYERSSNITKEQFLKQPHGDVRLPIGGNTAFRRRVFEDVGYFDEEYIGGWEEFEFTYRLLEHGYKVVVSPKPFVYRHPPSSLRELIESFYGYGKGAKIFEKKHNVQNKKTRGLTVKFFSTLLHSLKVSKKERSPRGILYLFFDVLLSSAYVSGILSESLPLRLKSGKQ